MPVPKRKTSKSRRDMRQSCKFIRPKAFAQCSNCETPILGHIVCGGCGFYKGRQVIVTKVARAMKRHTLRAAAHPAEAPAQQPE